LPVTFLSVDGATNYYIFMIRDMHMCLCIYLFNCNIFCRPRGNYVEKLQEKIRGKNCCQPELAAKKSGMTNRDESLTFSVAKSTFPLQIKSK